MNREQFYGYYGAKIRLFFHLAKKMKEIRTGAFSFSKSCFFWKNICNFFLLLKK